MIKTAIELRMTAIEPFSDRHSNRLHLSRHPP